MAVISAEMWLLDGMMLQPQKLCHEKINSKFVFPWRQNHEFLRALSWHTVLRAVHKFAH